MRYSIFFVFFLFFSAVSTVILLIGYRINIESLHDALLQREQAICEQVLENVKVLIGSKVDRLSNLADAMKFDNRLYRVFTSPNMSSSDLKDVGQTIQAQIDLPILEITDRKGSILYSAEPGRQVGGFSDLWGIDEALEGESPVIASRLDKDWVIRQFVPLKWGNDFYGTLHLGFKLNNEFIEQLSDVTNARLSITSLERVVAGIEDFDGLSREELFQSEFWNWLTEENVPLFMENSAKKHFTMYAAVRMVDETFCLILRMDTTDVYELLNEKIKYLKIAFLIIFLAMLVCCLLLTLYISRPLKRLQKKAERLALKYSKQGRKNTPKAAPKGNEIRQLEDKFDIMSDSILNAIEEKKESEEQLRQSEKKFRLIAENASDVIWVIELESMRIAYVSPSVESLLIYRPEELISRQVESVVNKDLFDRGYQRLRERMDEFLTNKIKNYVDKIPMTRKDGQDIWTETVTRFTVKKSGNRIELHGISRDITERKIGEEKRQQLILELNREVENRKQAEKKANKARLAAESANQTKTRFISTISHELRTPLNAVLGIAQVMQLDQMLSQEQKSNLSIILSSGKHLLNLINDILDLSKIESEKLVLKKENINLFQLSDDLERIILDRSHKKGVAVYFFISQKIPKLVRTDGTRLRQVLINLLGNAVKFTDTGSVSLSIKVSRNFPQGVLWSNYLKKGDFIWIEFSVNDTGIGIESKHLDRIFEAFFQTGTSKNVHEGTGLGLVISKMLIQVMGGRLKVESQIGQGSRFTFQIPMEIVNPGQLSATMPCKIEGLEPGQSDFRILVVDDKPGNRQVLINLLKPFGFDLRQASDGRQAVSISQEWQPHLIWMDIQMPVMDGWEAAKKIRNQGNKDTCIIAVSAVVLEPDLKASIIGRCDGYLAKPYNVEDIFILLNRHLNIKLVYEAMEPVSSKDSPKEDLVQSLKELPPDLVRQLVHSASVLDSATIHEIINNINKLNPFLADHLKNMAQEYHYEKISMLAQSVLE